MRGDRHEDVAPVKSGRHRVQPELAVGQLDGLFAATEGRDGPGEQPVIRADENAAARCHGDGPASSADTWIDDRDMHGGWQVADRLGEYGGAAAHVARLYEVGDIDESRARRDFPRHAVASCDEAVLQAVVGQEADVAIDGHDWPAYVARGATHSDDGHRPAGSSLPTIGLRGCREGLDGCTVRARHANPGL